MTYLTTVGDAVADGGATTYASPSLTVSGANKVMWALVLNSDSTPVTPTGVAWDAAGVNEALTLQGSGITFGTYANASLWRKIAPSDGTTKVVTATWAATKGERGIIVWVENDIDQTTPNGTVSSANGTAATVSAGAVTTTAGQRLLMLAHGFDQGIFPTPPVFDSPTGTERIEIISSGSNYDAGAAQEQTAAGSSTTPTWTLSPTGNGWACFAFALNIAAAPPNEPPPLIMAPMQPPGWGRG
jgi:hypothetical protein